MRLNDVLSILRGLAPEHLAEPWDKVGVQVGGENRDIKRSMLCVDLTRSVLGEAIQRRAELVVAYHPLIFKPLDGLRDDARPTIPWQESVAVEASRRRIAVYSPHTALDWVRDGVNDWLCAGLGKGHACPIKSNPLAESSDLKLVTFVPTTHAERVRQALFGAGAGGIGKYKECSFNSSGQGTFLPGEGSRPFLGKRGKLERADEIRIEMLCPRTSLAEVIAALRKAHPYEEPAFDLFPRRDEPMPAHLNNGQGRTMTLDEPVSLSTLVARIKRHLKVSRLEVAKPLGHSAKIKTIAVCAGAGASVLADAPMADAFLTGEMRHHEVLAAVQRGKVVLLAGHTQTERPYLPAYRRRILAADPSAKRVEWFISRNDQPPAASI